MNSRFFELRLARDGAIDLEWPARTVRRPVAAHHVPLLNQSVRSAVSHCSDSCLSRIQK
jgi:hypothetical protein